MEPMENELPIEPIEQNEPMEPMDLALPSDPCERHELEEASVGSPSSGSASPALSRCARTRAPPSSKPWIRRTILTTMKRVSRAKNRITHERSLTGQA